MRQTVRCLAAVLWTLLLAGGVAAADVVEEGPAYVAPPRRIEDVLRMLDHYKPDPAIQQRARELVAQPLPEGAAGSALVDFHLRRAAANARLGRIDQQVVELQAAIAAATPGSLQRATLLGQLATAESIGGNMLSAARVSDEALAQLPPGNPGRQLALLQAAAKYHAVLGNFSVARERLNRAEAVFEQLRGSRGWAMRGPMWTALIQRARAELFNTEGRFVEAEAAYRRALAAFETASSRLPPDADGEDRVQRYDGVLERSLANTLLAQGKVAEAEFYVRRALQNTLERVGRDSVDVAHALSLLANILSEQGRHAEATRLAEASLRAFADAGAAEDSFTLARARQSLAAALAAQGRHAEALALFEQNREILRRQPALLQRYGAGHPEWVLSLLGVGRVQEAERMAATMLEWSVARFGEGSTRAALRRALLGVARLAQDDFAGARALFEASVPALLAQARDDVEAETGTQRKQRYLILVLEAWLRALSAGEPDRAAVAEAFRLADIARSSAVERALTAAAARADLPDPALAELARREQDAQRRLGALSNLLIQLLGAPPNEQLPAIQGELRRDIASLTASRDDLRRQIADRYPDYAAITLPQAATLDQVQARLRPGEALVAFYVGERESYAWAVNALGERHFARVPQGREAVAAAVAHLRRALDAGVDSVDALPAFDVAAGHALYRRFLLPSAAVWHEAKTMVVVPHGALGQLPVALLPTAPATLPTSRQPFAAYREVPWLARQLAVQQLPSATALVSLRALSPRAPQAGSFAGFGDPLFSTGQARELESGSRNGGLSTRGRRLALRGTPDFSGLSSATLAALPRLPDTGQELKAIASALRADPQRDVFLQKEATERRVREMDLSRRRVVMFATHGLVPGDLDGLTQPALALTSPEVVPGAGNGLLTMDDVLSLRLDADWVVLSACNTAAGDGAGAEAVSGLGRAFFYAGARAMLVSNWPVETVSARLLMTDMFSRLGSDAGLSKPEALRRAMLALIDGPGASGPGGTAGFSYAHPMFWAPFVVVGD